MDKYGKGLGEEELTSKAKDVYLRQNAYGKKGLVMSSYPFCQGFLRAPILFKKGLLRGSYPFLSRLLRVPALFVAAR